MGGGCQTPIAAYASVCRGRIVMRAVAHLAQDVRRAEATGLLSSPVTLGEKVAARLLRPVS